MMKLLVLEHVVCNNNYFEQFFPHQTSDACKAIEHFQTFDLEHEKTM